jgi:hypothetical protein
MGWAPGADITSAEKFIACKCFAKKCAVFAITPAGGAKDTLSNEIYSARKSSKADKVIALE